VQTVFEAVFLSLADCFRRPTSSSELAIAISLAANGNFVLEGYFELKPTELNKGV